MIRLINDAILGKSHSPVIYVRNDSLNEATFVLIRLHINMPNLSPVSWMTAESNLPSLETSRCGDQLSSTLKPTPSIVAD